MFREALVVCVLAACGSPRPTSPPPGALPILEVPDAAMEMTSLVPVDAPPEPDLATIAKQHYALLGAGRDAEAEALLEGRQNMCPSTQQGATQRKDGGFLVWGGRVILRVDKAGAFESYTLHERCVAYVDETVQVTTTADSTVLSGATAAAETLAIGETFVDATDEWVLVGTSWGEYMAWPRGTATILRSPSPMPELEPDELPTVDNPHPQAPEPDRPRVVGRYLFIQTGREMQLWRKDGSHRTVKGCKGRVIDAVPTARGVALHVEPALGADTKLCMVNDRGATTRVVSLGHSICGLAERMACAWELQAASLELIVFGGLRGGVVVVDAASGARLSYRGEPNTQFPATYATCGEHRERICVTTSSENADTHGEMVIVNGAARFRALKAPAPEPNAAVDPIKQTWCSTTGDLLVRCRT